jgi:hypothetical protein
MKHIEIETLINKFEGRFADGDEREIAAHIADCSECAAESAKLADFFAYSEQHFTDVPQAVTARILNLYQRKPVPEAAKTNIGSRIASLIFDDWQMALNERYSGLDSRQLLYRIGDLEIDLRLELVGDMCRLTGQIFPEHNGATAEVLSATHSAPATFNEFGEFTFELMPQDIYDVRISIDNEDLTIEKAPLHR